MRIKVKSPPKGHSRLAGLLEDTELDELLAAAVAQEDLAPLPSDYSIQDDEKACWQYFDEKACCSSW